MLQAINVKITPQSNSTALDWDIVDDGATAAVLVHYSHQFHPSEGADAFDRVIAESFGSYQRLLDLQQQYSGKTISLDQQGVIQKSDAIKAIQP